jgi:hypothetical protein
VTEHDLRAELDQVPGPHRHSARRVMRPLQASPARWKYWTTSRSSSPGPQPEGPRTTRRSGPPGAARRRRGGWPAGCARRAAAPARA